MKNRLVAPKARGVVIRRARLSDLPVIHRLALTGKLRRLKKALPPYWIKAFITSREIVWVAVFHRRVAGFILGEKLVCQGAICHLIAVDKAFQRQGIGAQLAAAFEKDSRRRGIRWVLWYAIDDDPPVKALLKKKHYHPEVRVLEYEKDLA